LASPFWRRKGVRLGVGKAWISLDSLVRIEPFQWVTGDFLRKFFSCPFPVFRAALAGPVGRCASLSMPPSRCGDPIVSRLASESLSFNRTRSFVSPKALRSIGIIEMRGNGTDGGPGAASTARPTRSISRSSIWHADAAQLVEAGKEYA
jgi:hypothetical protein